MADRKSYPSIPMKTWWDLRRRFRTSPPGKVDADYLQSVLGVQEGQAKNLVSPLTSVGLIDDAGKLTDLAIDWRDDATYAQACQKILEDVYPQALRDAFPPPNPERSAVENWFARNVKVGTNAARKMATTYLLVVAADPAGETAQPTTNGAARTPAPKRTSAAPRASSGRRAGQDAGQAAAANAAAANAAASTPPPAAGGDGPSVHVDVQVHISPDATSDQIDAIFASMAKHLYAKKS
jgi:uncharacterized protein DUF5343